MKKLKEKYLWFCEGNASYYLKWQYKRPDDAIVGWSASELEWLKEKLNE